MILISLVLVLQLNSVYTLHDLAALIVYCKVRELICWQSVLLLSRKRFAITLPMDFLIEILGYTVFQPVKSFYYEILFDSHPPASF